MGKQSLFKKNVLDIKDNKSWLHNVYVLYFIFIIALGDLYYLMASHSWFYMTLFVLIGFLTSFFSKNMVVILCIAIAFTNILKTALVNSREGFHEGITDPVDQDAESITKTTTSPAATVGASSSTSTTGPSATKATATTGPAAIKATATTGPAAIKATATTGPAVTTTAPATTAETAGFTDGVYTTEEDMEYKNAYNQAEIVTNQEKIMKNLNKYKPLLETINSITKNIAVFKGGN